MKKINSRIVLGAGLLGLSSALAVAPAFAAPRDNDVKQERREVKEARKDVRHERQDVRHADTPAERRHERGELRDAERDLRHERGDVRDERRENIHDRWEDRRDDRRDDHHDNHHDNRPNWNNRPNAPRPGYGYTPRPGYGYGRPGNTPRPGYGQPGYNNGYGSGYGNGTRPGYGGNTGYGNNSGYSQSDFRQFSGYVVDGSNGGTFRVKTDNGQYFNVRSNAYVSRGQRVNVAGYLYNGAIVNARLN